MCLTAGTILCHGRDYCSICHFARQGPGYGINTPPWDLINSASSASSSRSGSDCLCSTDSNVMDFVFLQTVDLGAVLGAIGICS